MILVATDFSEGSAFALKFASELPEAENGIAIVHAVDSYDQELWTLLAESPTDLAERLTKELEQKLQEWTATTLSGKNIATRTFVRMGGLVEVAAKLVEEHDTEKIVCGSTGAGKTEARFLGSSAARLAFQSELPVTVVPEGAQTASTYLIPTDFSERSAQSLEYAIGCAHKNDGRLELLHVVPDSRGFSIVPGSEAIREEVEQKRKVEMDALVASVKERVPCDGSVAVGNVHESILARANEGAYEIIMPSYSHGTLGRIVFGSETERVLREAKVPVTVL